MYTHTHTYMYVYIYICIYVYTYIYKEPYTYIYYIQYICIVHICVVCMCVHKYMHVYMCVHICVHIHVHVYTCVCVKGNQNGIFQFFCSFLFHLFHISKMFPVEDCFSSGETKKSCLGWDQVNGVGGAQGSCWFWSEIAEHSAWCGQVCL